AVGEHGMIYRYRPVAEGTPLATNAMEAIAMPPLANGVIEQIAELEVGLGDIEVAVAAAGDVGGARLGRSQLHRVWGIRGDLRHGGDGPARDGQQAPQSQSPARRTQALGRSDGARQRIERRVRGSAASPRSGLRFRGAVGTAF